MHQAIINALAPSGNSAFCRRELFSSAAAQPAEGNRRAGHSQQAAAVKINETGSAKEALNLAVRKAGPQDLILITGSLFLVGQLRRLIV